MIDQAESDARAMAQRATQHGYGFANFGGNVVRVKFTKRTSVTEHFLNNLPVSREYLDRLFAA
jgi:hypothetical protein